MLALADGEAAIYPLSLASGKLRVAISRVLEMEPRSWAMLCGWHFGFAEAQVAGEARDESGMRGTSCARCRRSVPSWGAP